MAVVIEEFEHVAPPEGGETHGPGGGAPSGGAALSEQAIRAQVLAAIQREASRQARLWAD